jgi:vibriolysin
MRVLNKLFVTGAACLSMSACFAAQIIDLDSRTIRPNAFELQKVSSARLQDGVHTRFHQLIKGFPVYGYHIIKHETASGTHYTGKQLQYGKQDHFPVRAQFDVEAAFNKVAAQFNDPQFSELKQKKSKLMYYVAETGQVHLAYVLNYYADNNGQPHRPFAIIDAVNSHILKRWQGLTTDQIGRGPGGNEKTGQYLYGAQFRSLHIKINPDQDTCSMDSTHVRTINLNNETTGSKAFTFKCPEHPGEAANGSYSVINDAQYFANTVYDMFESWYHIPPLKNKLIMRVHYGKHYENAFWNGRNMTFGDGKDRYYPFMAADVVAHEVAHGFTEQHAALEYWGQSGAINESFSDMSGKAMEQYTQLHYDWTVGTKFSKSKPALRYMDDPHKDGKSINDARHFNANINVHHASESLRSDAARQCHLLAADQHF